MLRDVKTTITDGGLAAGGTKGEGIHFKIGVSPVGAAEPIRINGTMNAKSIKEKLGMSPLADACMLSVENGSNIIYCIPVQGSVAGTIKEIQKSGLGKGNCTVEGKPYNDYDIAIRFEKQGGFNQAVFRYSIDNEFSYSDEITLSLNGEFELPQTGLKLKFTEDAVDKASSFQVGDSYKFSTTAPQMTNQDALTALEKMRASNISFEYVHIVGESTKTLWSALAIEAEKLLSEYHKPLFFILEARRQTPEEKTIDEYVQYLVGEQKGLISYDIQVVAARSLYTRMDGSTKDINNAGIVCGLYSKARVCQSIGETKVFSIPENKMLKLLPEGIENYISALDEAKYLTFRKYEGLENFYVTNARMMAAEGSDYQYAERVRVKNKIVRETRKEALLQLQSEVDMSDPEGSLQAIAKFIETPLDKMTTNKEISSARIVIPEGQDVLTTEKLKLLIRYVPKGYIRELEIDLGMENPFRK